MANKRSIENAKELVTVGSVENAKNTKPKISIENAKYDKKKRILCDSCKHLARRQNGNLISCSKNLRGIIKHTFDCVDYEIS
jgi:hypothetical protein